MSGGSRDDAEAVRALGLDAAELRVYELLLDEPGSRVADVAAASGWSARRVQRALAALELKGLATRSAHRSARFLPTPPDIAIEALIAKRQDELQHARVAATRLLRERPLAAKKLRERARVVELVTGRDAQARVFEQIQRGAREELLSIERPPYVVGVDSGNEVQEQAMARGVVYRNILEADALRIPGKLENMRRLVAAGERTRVFSGLPMKLLVVDRRVALIPLDIARASESALLLRPSSLLDALCELFEMLWRRATPIGFAASGAPVEDAPRARAGVRAEPDQLVPLLAAGMNDKAIAHRLGVSARTLERRIVDLARELDARTRFQAGWRAALRSVGLD